MRRSRSLELFLIELAFKGQVEEGKPPWEFETESLEEWKENKSSELSLKERK